MRLGSIVVCWSFAACTTMYGQAAEALPTVKVQYSYGRVIVHGKPFLILGGELGNSSAGTASQADTILPRLAGMQFNTVLMPVAWEQIERVEGRFDFSIFDHCVDLARQNKIRLVLLWKLEERFLRVRAGVGQGGYQTVPESNRR